MFLVVEYYEKWYIGEIGDCHFITHFCGTYEECQKYCQGKEMADESGYGFHIVEIGKEIVIEH